MNFFNSDIQILGKNSYKNINNENLTNSSENSKFYPIVEESSSLVVLPGTLNLVIIIKDTDQTWHSCLPQHLRLAEYSF